MGGDLYVSSSVSMRDEVKKHLESVEGVEAVAPIRYLEAEWRKPDGVTDSIVFMGIDPSAHSQVTTFVFSATAVPILQKHCSAWQMEMRCLFPASFQKNLA